MAEKTIQPITFTPAETPPPAGGVYLVAYDWTHPTQRGPLRRFRAGEFPVTQAIYGLNEGPEYEPEAEEPSPGCRWGNIYDNGPLNEFMKIVAWAPMPVYYSPAPNEQPSQPRTAEAS